MFKIAKVFSYVRRLFELATAAAPLLEALRELLPAAHGATASLGRVESALQRLLAGQASLRELRAELDVELGQADIGPRTRELLVKVRAAIDPVS